MKILTVDSQPQFNFEGMVRAVGDAMPIDADYASGRTAECQCGKCRAKRRSTLTVADLEKTMVGPRGRPPRTVAEMRDYTKQFYAKERA
jgi:hypothetical protein